jgi:oligopeptide/dipeptide ABC transporter ATP-binding protein
LTQDPVLQIRNLKVQFSAHNGVVKAVDDVSLAVDRGRTVGIVGESGCGKSIMALSVLRLAPRAARIVGGEILFEGRNLLALEESELQRIRGNKISMIFQEPMTSLNPVLTIGDQIAECFLTHRGLSQSEARDRTAEMLRLVQIPDPIRRAKEYPHQMSGGMRQRVMIAMALACSPQLLIADEPTTALDVTIQAQILRLMRELQDKLGTAILLISHDLGLVAQNVERVIVMYAGRKVEEGLAKDLFAAPRHPYTSGLLQSVPRLSKTGRLPRGQGRLPEIAGTVPALSALPRGCSFAPRCLLADGRCRTERPSLEEQNEAHWVACWHSHRMGAARTRRGAGDD